MIKWALLFSFFVSVTARGTVFNMTTLALNAVQGTNAVAVDGDTIMLPAGGAYWNGRVNVTNAVSFIGAGTNAGTGTFITNVQGYSSSFPGANELFCIQPGNDKPMTIKNIYMVDTNFSATSSLGIMSGYANPLCPTQIRITGCVFAGFRFAIADIEMFGVCDHCMFIDNYDPCRTDGWTTNTYAGQFINSTPFPIDTTNTWDYEDNIFILHTNGPVEYFGDSEFPCQLVVRNNIFQVALMPGIEEDDYDMHGNGNALTGGSLSLNSLGVQIYNNTFNYSWPNGGSQPQPKLSDVRGGSGSMVYSNTVNGITAYATFRANPAGSIAPSNSWFFVNSASAGAFNAGDDGTATAGLNYSNAVPPNFKQMVYPNPLITGNTSSVASSVTITIGAGATFTIGPGATITH